MSDLGLATARDPQIEDTAARFRPTRVNFVNFEPQHFLWQIEEFVATITLNRPERKIRLRSNRTPSYVMCFAILSMRRISKPW